MNSEEIPESCGAISWLRFDSLLVQSINYVLGKFIYDLRNVPKIAEFVELLLNQLNRTVRYLNIQYIKGWTVSH